LGWLVITKPPWIATADRAFSVYLFVEADEQPLSAVANLLFVRAIATIGRGRWAERIAAFRPIRAVVGNFNYVAQDIRQCPEMDGSDLDAPHGSTLHRLNRGRPVIFFVVFGLVERSHAVKVLAIMVIAAVGLPIEPRPTLGSLQRLMKARHDRGVFVGRERVDYEVDHFLSPPPICPEARANDQILALVPVCVNPIGMGRIMSDEREPSAAAKAIAEEVYNLDSGIVGFEDHLVALRNANAGAAITVWKDGTWKAWQTLDAQYAEKDENWLCTIKMPTAISDAVDVIRSVITRSPEERVKPTASDDELARWVFPDIAFRPGHKTLARKRFHAALAEARREDEIAMRERAVALAHHYASFYPHGSDGRNTFELYAEALTRGNTLPTTPDGEGMSDSELEAASRSMSQSVLG
jgi:hypothetical protein